MIEEIWKPVVGFEHRYMISNFGRIKSIDRKVVYSDGRVYNYKGKILKTHVNKHDGYVYFNFTKHNYYTNNDYYRKTKNLKIHRLVAEAFIDNPYNLPCVNHKDEDKTNNHYSNLEWCTQSYNIIYSMTEERCLKVKRKITEKIGKKVVQFTFDGCFVEEFDSIKEASRKTKLPHSEISRCCSGKRGRKSVGGFIFKYK